MNYRILPVLLFCGSAMAQTTSPSPYCDASFDDMNGFPVADAVNSVSIGTLTNASNAQYAAPHYVFYNNLQAPDLVKGNTYALTAAFAVHGGCGYGVWIDYNHNNQFEANEAVAGATAGNNLDLSDNTIVTVNVTIPASAVTGQTRMRVRIVEDDQFNAQYNFATAPCNASTSDTDVMDWGETEDYTVNITGSAGLEEQQLANVSVVLVNDRLTVSGIEVQHAMIVDLSGKTVQAFYGQQADVSALVPGLYVVQIETPDGRFAGKKIVK